MGWAPSWFRIGRDYETLGDLTRAKSAFERGLQMHDVSCTYRLGMAYLVGQLDIPIDQAQGVKLLRKAAEQSTVDTPYPAYIFALLLADELEHVSIPVNLFASGDATRESLAPLARKFLERAAYLNLSAAQLKCGWCYEHASMGFPFDPLLSVQYYSAASQGGEPDADMALSKWFLCGAENCFDKNEALAWTFADRAAKHGLPTAEFALGYYCEVGIGHPVDIAASRSWYAKAAAQGNTDARDRLNALEHSMPRTVSRDQHQQHVTSRLNPQRANAMEQPASRAHVGGQAQYGHEEQKPMQAGAPNVELARSRTMRMAEASAQRPTAPRRSRPRPWSGLVPKGNSAAPPSKTASPKKGYTTFSEMGIQPKQDRDCVIC